MWAPQSQPKSFARAASLGPARFVFRDPALSPDSVPAVAASAETFVVSCPIVVVSVLGRTTGGFVTAASGQWRQTDRRGRVFA